MASASTMRNPHPVNIVEYVTNKNYHMESGWIGGKVYFRNRFFDEKEFVEMFPVELKYPENNADKTQIPKS
jgi:hypothetical protein